MPGPRIIIPATYRDLFNKEVRWAVEYIPGRSDYAAHQEPADELLAQVEASPTGDLTADLTGGLAVAVSGCICQLGSEVHDATEQGASPESRGRIRKEMSDLEFWVGVAEQIEVVTGVSA